MDFRAKVALAAVNGERTVADLAAVRHRSDEMITTWKKQAIEGMSSTFSNKPAKEAETTAAEVAAPRQDRPIGGTGFCRTPSSVSVERRRRLVEPSHPVFRLFGNGPWFPSAGRGCITGHAERRP